MIIQSRSTNISIICRRWPSQVGSLYGIGASERQSHDYAAASGGLDAFDGVLRGEPFDTTDDSAICIENCHMLVADDENLARGVLDIIEQQSRHYLLFGKRQRTGSSRHLITSVLKIALQQPQSFKTEASPAKPSRQMPRQRLRSIPTD